MNVEQQINTTLAADSTVSGLVSARIYPLLMPSPPVLPALVYQRVADAPQFGVDGYHNLEQVRVQLSCWDKTYAGAKTLAAATRAAMAAAPLYGIFLMDLDDYDSETKLYRVLQDFSIWN